MATVAYYDLRYHKKTHSSDFLVDMLERQGNTVTRFWDDPWSKNSGIDIKELLKFDSVVLFQSVPKKLHSLKKHHKNITFIPMLDSYNITAGKNEELSWYWNKFFGVKILNFSKTLHYVSRSFGLESLYFQFFTPLQKKLYIPVKQGLHGFFLARRADQISLSTIFILIDKYSFDSLHIHFFKDPDSPEFEKISDELRNRHHITTSTWFDNKDDYYKQLEKANIFFAPRLQEGFGQSIMEALSRGLCVVSPDTGAMNEYIRDGINGLLYNHEKPRPLVFENIESLCLNSYKTVEYGFEKWKQQEKEIVDFIINKKIRYRNLDFIKIFVKRNRFLYSFLLIVLNIYKRITKKK